MAKFKYKMQNILNLKYKLEEQQKIAFAEATGRVLEEEKKLLELNNRRFFYELKLKESVSGSLDLNRIRQLGESVEIMKFRIRVQQIALKDAKLRQEQERRKLNEAMIERKTQEKLREKAFEEFKKELAKEESKEVDELVSYKFGQMSGQEAG